MLKDKVKKNWREGKGREGIYTLEAGLKILETEERVASVAGSYECIDLITFHCSPASALKCLPGALLRGCVLHPAAEGWQ